MTKEQLEKYDFPLPPWSLENSNDGQKGFISRYGAEEAEKIYCRLARDLGYGLEGAYRPSLDPTPFLSYIKAQHKPQPQSQAKE